MRFPVFAACLLVSLPAYAQGPSVAATDCTEFAATLGIVEQTPDAAIEDIDDGCRLRNVYLSFGPYTRFRAEEIVLRAPGVFQEFAQERLPTEVDLLISGFTNAPDAGSPLMSYIVEMQSQPMQIHLAYRWDREARTVDLSDFSATAQSGASFRFAVRLSETELDPDRFSDLLRLPGQIDEVQLDLTNASFFGSFAVSGLLSSLPSDQDPRPLVADYKAAVTSFIQALPAAVINEASKTVLSNFIDNFPRLQGDIGLIVEAPDGLAFTSLPAENPADIAGLLGKLRITATNTPAHLN